MQQHTNHRRWIFSLAAVIMALTVATPALAEYIGPKRTVTETRTVCKVILKECGFSTEKQEWRYKTVDSWSCSLEGKPWQAYSNNQRACNDTLHTDGYQYWEREDVTYTETNTYPPATITGAIQSCTLRNGWCITPSQLSLTGFEPVAGYTIIGLEGTLNGQTFACTNASCNVPLSQGNNNFTYWALSSFLDSSQMGSLTAKVDSFPPNISASLSGTAGLNTWYLGSVTLNSSASDATSGLASFTCTRDGTALASCNSITISGDGPHTTVLTARDNAGHTRTLTQNTSIDSQNPVLNASLNGTQGSNNWYTSATLNASASDPAPGSGISAIQYNFDSGGWIAFPASGALGLIDGQHTVEVRALDKAGRSASSSTSFSLDSVAPGASLDSSGTLGLNDWYVTNPTLSVSASDDTSGLAFIEYSLDNSNWTEYTAPLRLSDGIHSISVWAHDQAGLVTEVNRTYQVDTRPPQIAGSLSGLPGLSGWFISEVTISASASDPLPASDIDTFTYTLNGSAETSYAGPLTLSDGQHTLQFRARDKAGLSHSVEQTFSIDTTPPSLTVDSALPGWVSGAITLAGTAGDNGSGLSSMEISFDDGQTWQTVTGTNAWTHTWNTADGLNGIHEVRLRAMDQAGLNAEQSVQVAVDNRPPEISLPASWLQWDSVTLNILDEHSGLSEARVEISDPQGRWPTRVIQLDPGQFPLALKWDRRFADDTIAESGTYNVKVFARDRLGHATEKSAEIHILLEILPPGPTSTPPFTPTAPVNTPTPAFSPTATSVIAATRTSSPTAPVNGTASTATPRATQIVVVHVFGTIEAPAQTTPTPATISTPRPTPTQLNVTNLLQSIFEPDTVEQSTTEISTPSDDFAQPLPKPNSVLWGTAATAAIAAATAYAEEERRKREEEIARQKELEERKEERDQKMKEKKIAKMDAIRAQEAAWEDARQEAWNAVHIAVKVERFEQEESETWAATQAEIKQQYEEKKQAEAEKKQTEKEMKKAHELQSKLLAYYATIQQKENEKEVPKSELSWWEQTKSFISENIIQPVNTYVYQPLVKPTLTTMAETSTTTMNWLHENLYQPHIEPVIEKNKEFLVSEFAWIDKNIYEPYVKPALVKVNEVTTNIVTQIKEKVYQPYIKPAIEKTLEKVSNGIKWVDNKIYQPYIQPVVKVIDEKVYQPHVKPVVEKVNEIVTQTTTWVNENIYQPYLEPVVTDINQHIYQPLVNQASNWWDEYGEWVHGALDAAGFIPGLGEIADGLNGLIYLGEGRYLEASLSTMSMIPLLGDLGKVGKWTFEAGEELVEKVAKESVQEAIDNAVDEISQGTIEEILEEVSDETVHRILKDVVEGQVTKLPPELLQNLTKEGASELVEKISKELGGKKVWVSTNTGSMYVSSPPAEGFLLAEQLSKIDLTKKDEVEKILKRVAELTSRGSGNHVILGPFRPNGTFIQKALDTNGVFWDVGDELWEALAKTGIDMFDANDQFLRVQIDNGIDRFDVIGTDVNEVIDDLNNGPISDWVDLKYTQKEILDLASMPDIPYQLVDNSWVRVDLINSPS